MSEANAIVPLPSVCDLRCRFLHFENELRRKLKAKLGNFFWLGMLLPPLSGMVMDTEAELLCLFPKFAI